MEENFCKNNDPKQEIVEESTKKKKIFSKAILISVFAIVFGCGVFYYLWGYTCMFHHTWSPATCTAPQTCEKCGAVQGEALPHPYMAPTCTDPKICIVCGKKNGKALGHKWEDPTCTKPKTCSVCGKTEGKANGHTWVEATCSAPKTCSACGIKEGDPLPHNYDGAKTEVAQAATCTAVGKGNRYCTVCGYKDTYDIPATGHTPGDWQIQTYAKLSKAGTKVRKCTKCGTTVETTNYRMSASDAARAENIKADRDGSWYYIYYGVYNYTNEKICAEVKLSLFDNYDNALTSTSTYIFVQPNSYSESMGVVMYSGYASRYSATITNVESAY